MSAMMSAHDLVWLAAISQGALDLDAASAGVGIIPGSFTAERDREG
jgi:hypothetical protein